MSAQRSRDRARIRSVMLTAMVVLACEGSGRSGDGLVVEDELLSSNCTPVAGDFPSGFTLNPGNVNRATLVQFNPPAIVAFRVDSDRPVEIAKQTIDPDSDMDGVADDVRSTQEGFFPLSPVMGVIDAVDSNLGLVTASNYEEILFVDLSTGVQVSVLVENPSATGDFDPNDYPFLPPPGEAHLRSAVSTRTCVFPPDPFDSRDDPIPAESRCDPDAPGYFTNLTSGTAIAAGHLFVTTSNLRSTGLASFYPGTVLVYDWDETDRDVPVRPNVDTRMIFTTGFNPTDASRFITPSGRVLVLVTITGAIGGGSGSSNLFTEAAVDVIDAKRLRVVASIPLGLAGPSFDDLAIDPSGRIALLGASSNLQLYAVDLAPLDDPRLYEGDGPPVLLDGLTPGFPDARIFTADAPLVLPDRSDGPSPAQCEGFTHVAINAAGTEAFATDHCDGTLTRISLKLSDSPPVPVPADHFQAFAQSNLTAPLTAASIGLPRAPGILRVRAGAPGIDYTGPDVLLTTGLPDAALCGVRMEVL